MGKGEMREVILVSACLLGIPCRWDGKAARNPLELSMLGGKNIHITPVCPEQLAGFPTPRSPVEIVGGDGFDVLEGRANVKTREGEDVTGIFLRGARLVGQIATIVGATRMISQGKSPSCSNIEIYDGTFSHELRKGVGVTSAFLRTHSNVEVIDVADFKEP